MSKKNRKFRLKKLQPGVMAATKEQSREKKRKKQLKSLGVVRSLIKSGLLTKETASAGLNAGIRDEVELWLEKGEEVTFDRIMGDILPELIETYALVGITRENIEGIAREVMSEQGSPVA